MSTQGNLPKLWMVRAGRHGEDEDVALNQGYAIAGFRSIDDLTRFKSFEDLVAHFRSQDPGGRVRSAEVYARQMIAFRDKISMGDLIVLPLKTHRGQIAIGRVRGAYQFAEVVGEKRHVRKVEWIRPDLPRSAFQQDLLYSFGTFITICRITRHGAEHRVEQVLQGKTDPGYEGEKKEHDDEQEVLRPLDIAQAAHDEIIASVRARFPGHDMARLVEALLQAEGLVTQRSAPGPDGGADILAARGMLGLDQPTLCVQVKATDAPADVTTFRALQGTMTSFQASQGLLVCWGGFTQPVRSEARQHTFRIRLWDQSDLVEALYRAYDRLPEEIQAELPLKRVWVLVREDLEAAE